MKNTLWILVGLLSLPVQAQILAEDIDAPAERRSFHLLCAATASLTSSEMIRELASTSLGEQLPDIAGEPVIEMLNTVAKLHFDTALSMGASQGDVDLALALVRLVNNGSENTASEFRLVARTEFLTAYCMVDPNEL